MKHALAFACLMGLASTAAAEVETYTLDPYHTIPHFTLDYWGYGMLTGRFDKSSGKFTIDRAAKTGSLELVVETASVSTADNDKGPRTRSRDEHLRAADFFNATEFPRMTFKSRAVKFNGDAPVQVDGDLTLLGVTKPVTLKIDRWVCKPHAIYKKPACGGNATALIKRSEFGMKYGVPNMGDDVTLSTFFLAFKD
jgi:polyisoprenoid-binding protein YceI